jgi:serine/threonine-protein kinase Chk2
VVSDFSVPLQITRHADYSTDLIIDSLTVSNRHCIIFPEQRLGDTVAIMEDLSSNGTFVNEAIVGRNQRRELNDQDEIAIHDKAHFIFHYPRSRHANAFKQQYLILEKLGTGHFAEVFLCVERSTGYRYAVKIFTKTPGLEEWNKTTGLQQEIGVLMGMSHENVLCLRDIFYEHDRIYMVLELALEGDLFNCIVLKQRLSEAEARKVLRQIFEGVKYLVSYFKCTVG